MGNFSELLNKNSTDPKTRVELGQQLLDLIQREGVPNDANNLTLFMDVMVQWLNGTNFKVALLALEILSLSLEVSGATVSHIVLENASTIMERLGDNREQVRQDAVGLLLKLMNTPGCTPQSVLDRIVEGFSHKQWLVRIGVMIVLQQILRSGNLIYCIQLALTKSYSYGPSCLQLGKLVPSICRLLADPMNQVRDVATETLVEMYVFLGDKLAMDIQRKQLVPNARAAALFSRFEDVKRNGLVGSSCSSNGTVGSALESVADFTDATPTAHRQISSVSTLKKPLLTAVKQSEVSNFTGKRATSAPPVKRLQTTSRYAGNAGAVDEDSFYAAFEDVPKVEIYSAKELSIQLQQIRTIVMNTNGDWEKRVDSLKRLRSLLISGASQYDEFFVELRSLEVPMQIAGKDLRSQVVREVCITVAYLAERLGPKFDHFAEIILPLLISLIQNSAKVVSTSGLISCRFIIKNTHAPRIVPVITGSLESKSKEIRRCCCDFIAMMCRQWSSHELEKNVGALQGAIRKGLSDADPEARAFSRKAYWSFSDHFRDQAEMLFQSLDPGKQRQLLGEISQSSSSHSLYNDLRTSQESVKCSTASQYGASRAGGTIPCLRSASEIDTGAVRRAVAMKQANAGKAFLGVASSSNMNSLPRPMKMLLSTSGNYPKFGRFGAPNPSTATTATSTRLESTPRSPTSTSNKSVSQPGSRSSSPTARSSLTNSARRARPIANITGFRSQTSSRDSSPSRTPRRLSTPDRSYYSFGRFFCTPARDADCANVVGINRGRKLDDVSSESSPCFFGERSFRGSECSENSSSMMDVLRSCSSTVWIERKEGLLCLQSFFRSGGRLTAGELKKACDLFARLFVDPHHKMFTVFLDTVIEFLQAHGSDIQDWLFVLLCRLLSKQSNELLPSVQSKLLKTMDVVRAVFPVEAQFQALTRYLVDPTQTPNVKMKLNVLNYLNALIYSMQSSHLTDTADMRMAISRIVQWTGEPKSTEVRRTAQATLLALFSLNTAMFSQILSSFSKAYQDTVSRILHTHVRHFPDLSTLCIHDSAEQSSKVIERNSDVQDSLRRTSEEIMRYPFSSDCKTTGSNGSTVMDSVDNYFKNGSAGQGGRLELLSNGVNTDEERQEEIIGQILTELSNHNARNVERKKALSTLKHVSRDGSFTLWEENFKTILLILLETLGDDDPDIRAAALPVLKEICTRQPQRFQDYAELTILKLLDAHKDPERKVTRAAEDCATVLALHLAPLVCLRVLTPVILNDQGPALLAAIKMTTKVIEQMDTDELLRILKELVPGIIMGFENPTDSSVRKASVLCLVAVHKKVGFEVLEPFLEPLNSSKPTWAGRKCIIFLVDCDSAMFTEATCTAFQESITAIRDIYCHNSVTGERDYLATVLYNTKKAENSHRFNGISVLHNLSLPSVEKVKQLERLCNGPPFNYFDENYGTGQSNIDEVFWLSAMMYNECKVQNQRRTIFLFTNNDSPHHGDVELRKRGRKKIKDLKEKNVTVEVVAVGTTNFVLDNFYKVALADEHACHDDNLTLANRADDLFSRLFLHISNFEKNHEINDQLLIFCRYNNISTANLPPSVMLDGRTNGEVKLISNLFDPETGEKLHRFNLVKYQEYGRRRIAVTEKELEEMSSFTSPGLVLLGFQPLNRLKVYHHLRPAFFISPNENIIKGSAVLLNALMRKCSDKEMTMICRLTARKNTSPRLVALVAEIEESEEAAQSTKCRRFHGIYLPYEDDLRDLQAVIASAPKIQVDNQLVDLWKKVIKRMQIQYTVGTIQNPVLQKHYRTLEAVVLDREKIGHFVDQTMNLKWIDNEAGMLLEQIKEHLNFDDQKKSSSSYTDVEFDLEAEARNGLLGKRTVVQLRNALRSKGVVIASNTRKPDIIKRILDLYAL
ncbi:CLIP-associating protein 1-B [Trichinella patagoniensis]|uniref:CLIP-associating protein 1-B n=1 Tax=Trichinella patagoniensis TaxID=990121 RepID=A0A0V1AB28_9BILA|nr:CLIP-associating protein 1-B [Trichinella patagoniensis]